MRDGLLGALRARFDAVAANPTTLPDILAPEALSEAEQLLDHLAISEGADAEVLHAVGLLHWLRAAANPAAHDDWAHAVLFLAPLYLKQPEALPEVVVSSFTEARGSAEPTGEERAHEFAETLSNLGMFLLDRFHRVGRAPDGEAAIQLLRQSLDGLPAGHESRAMVECNLGYALLLGDLLPRMHDGTVELPRIDEAIARFRDAFAATPEDHPNYSRCANGLALSLRAKATLDEHVPLLDESIELFRAAVRTATGEEENFPQLLTDFGSALMVRANSDEQPDSAMLDEAIAVLHRAVQLSPEHAPELPGRQNMLATALLTRHQHQHRPGDLHVAISVLRRALDTSEPIRERPSLLIQLGSSLVDGYELGLADTSLDEAMEVLKEALQALPEESAERTYVMGVVARASMLRAPESIRSEVSPETRQRMDAIDDLIRRSLPTDGASGAEDPDNPIAVVARLLGMAVNGGDSRNAQAMDLASSVLRYPSEVGMGEILRKTFEGLRTQVAHLAPEERPEALLRFLSSDAQAHAGTVDTESLDEVLDLQEQLLLDPPDDRREHALLRLTHLQLRMVRRHPGLETSKQGLEDLAEIATMAMEELPSLMRDGGVSVQQMEPMAMMGHALLSPFESLLLTERSLAENRTKLRGLEEGDPERTATMKRIAQTLFLEYGVLRDEAIFQEAVDLARQVVSATSGSDARLLSSWGAAAASRAHHSLMLPVASSAEHDLQSSALARAISNQATSAISYNDGPGALETLEDGRAMMFSSALNTRREVENLRRADPQLAEEFVALREEILAGVEPTMEATPEAMERFGELAADWNEMVGRIKALSEFDRFLMPLPLGLSDLLPAAQDGPVVTVNVHVDRCDALALRADGVRVVPLPNLHVSELLQRVDTFRSAIGTLGSGSSTRDERDQAQQHMLAVLGWLWDVAAEPVLDGLGFTAPPGADEAWPRLWWSPTGPLNFLPLHAAGHHQVEGDSVLDRAVSSYTPTLRALLLSRANEIAAERTPLAVAMPETRDHSRLPKAEAEATAVTSKPIIGSEATRAKILSALPGASIAHFACHALSDPADPWESHLLLHDGPLTVTEISRLPLERAELAYLSACATARGSTKLADEAIHIASAFQLAGYGQVVGTQWPIDDNSAATMAADFHHELAAAIDDPARLPGALALHHATRRLRAAKRSRPSTWAAYVHAGA